MAKNSLSLIYPELKDIDSTELDYGALPDDVDDCCISMAAHIGTSDTKGADLFYFCAITPSRIDKEFHRKNGKGYLVVDRFSWKKIEKESEEIMAECSTFRWSSHFHESNTGFPVE